MSCVHRSRKSAIQGQPRISFARADQMDRGRRKGCDHGVDLAVLSLQVFNRPQRIRNPSLGKVGIGKKIFQHRDCQGVRFIGPRLFGQGQVKLFVQPPPAVQMQPGFPIRENIAVIGFNDRCGISHCHAIDLGSQYQRVPSKARQILRQSRRPASSTPFDRRIGISHQ